MKFLLAPDKFKGSIDSISLCKLIGQEILTAYPDAEVLSFPLSDGGDGFEKLVQHYFNTEPIVALTIDPLGRSITAQYQYSSSSNTAFIEMAAASGMALLKKSELNPMRTTTYGTGLLIRDAIKRGAQHILLGIGGSATNDGGIGMADALGYMFLDKNGDPLDPCGDSLSLIHEIIMPESDILEDIQFTVACDVRNPFCGLEGAAHIYAAQKGASKEQINELDEGLKHLDSMFMKYFDRSVIDLPGAGAAGGLGGGCDVFLGARLLPGVDYLSESIGLEQHIKEADIIITGEGSIDEQSMQGKVVGYVAGLAGRSGKRIRIVCGESKIERRDHAAMGIERLAALVDFSTSQEDAIASPNLFIAEAVRAII
jgi:glycerate kinase